jgi:secreted trypsin-like serine protease
MALSVDNRARDRLMRAMRALALALFLFSSCPAAAMVGGAAAAPDAMARAVVLIVGSRGNFCTGAALASDLVLTAAHCVLPGADYKIVEYDSAKQPQLRDVKSVTAHPNFELKALLAHRATADVALLKLAAPLKNVEPATLGSSQPVAPGDTFTVAGLGVAVRGDGKTGGTARAADLVATGRPGNLQIRLHDPATRGEKPGLGACTGDSGAPVFRATGGRVALIGLVSWSTGPGNSAGCGGLTGVTPLFLYRDWVTRSVKILGNPIGS